MAKKKQLVGKQTKLAKLPLTQVLARHTEETAPLGRPIFSPSFGSQQLPLSWQKAGAGSAGPLAAAYFQVVQELAALRSHLQPDPEALPKDAGLPPHLPAPHQINQALRQAQKDLQNLYLLLSQG